MGLHPSVEHLHLGDRLAWLNYSSKVARISFPASVVERLTCSAPVSFRMTGSRFESADIESDQFASLCQLAPGAYRYRVELRSGIGAGHREVPRTLRGTIFVE